MFVQTNIAHTQMCMSDRKICTTPQLEDRNRLAGKWKSRHCSLVAKKLLCGSHVDLTKNLTRTDVPFQSSNRPHFSEQTIGAEAERNFRRTIWEEKPAQAIAPNPRSVGEPYPVSDDGHSIVHEEDNRPLKGVFICTYRLIRPVARRIASEKGEPPARFGVNHHFGIVFGRQTVWSGQRKRLQGTPSDEEQRRYHSGRSVEGDRGCVPREQQHHSGIEFGRQTVWSGQRKRPQGTPSEEELRRYHSGRSVEGDRGGVPREQHVRRSKSSPVTHGGPNQHSSRIRCAMCSCVVRPRNALKMVRCSRSGSHL
ncbi:uncharacterized protein LOC110675131 [Aedes aegypti]|uniref:Uncharacterized protein n=1 Tax=Aedes aegypti TaxID=7159 RepID=A0A6I8TLX6_AEDAE|nr:uncharacterized protein LOC110675131 [Aedes aegypti]